MDSPEWWAKVRHWEIWVTGIRGIPWEQLPYEAQDKLREARLVRFRDDDFKIEHRCEISPTELNP